MLSPGRHFQPEFLNICLSKFKNKFIQWSQTSSQVATAKNYVEHQNVLIDYFEYSLSEVYFTFHPLVFPNVDHDSLQQMDFEARSKFTESFIKTRIQRMIDVTIEAMGRMPGLRPELLSTQENNQVVTMLFSAIWVFLLFPIFDFDTGRPKWFCPGHPGHPADNHPRDVTRRYFGFWLSYLRNMDVDFTELALLLPLAIVNAVRQVSPTACSGELLSTEQAILAALQNHALTRSLDSEGMTRENRWMMLHRNLGYIFEGVFECGREQIDTVNRLLDGKTVIPNQFEFTKN